jgi:hypothetical protein
MPNPAAPCGARGKRSKVIFLRLSLLGILVGTLVTITSLAAAIYIAGAGDGSYALAKLLFPFAMFAAVLGHSIGAPSFVLASVQFPTYGLILGRSFRTSSFLESAVWIVLVHFAATVFVFAYPGVDFS